MGSFDQKSFNCVSLLYLIQSVIQCIGCCGVALGRFGLCNGTQYNWTNRNLRDRFSRPSLFTGLVCRRANNSAELCMSPAIRLFKSSLRPSPFPVSLDRSFDIERCQIFKTESAIFVISVFSILRSLRYNICRRFYRERSRLCISNAKLSFYVAQLLNISNLLLF